MSKGKTAHLSHAPFGLDTAAIRWVEQTCAGLSPEQRLAQLMVPLLLDRSIENLDRLLALGIGGLLHFPFLAANSVGEELRLLQAQTRVPLLACADFEFIEGLAIGGAGGGTTFPNQMAVGATNDPENAARMARVVAHETRPFGFNWSLTPVADLSLEPRSVTVNTRSFGSNASRVEACARAYIAALQAGGMAACAKHFPGDGVDDRNQHYVTSVNRLLLEEWRSTFGRVFRGLIEEGVLTFMSAHIALPAYPGAGLRPASISRELNLGLLRGELGFNGLIVADASTMGGIVSHGSRETLLPEMIECGCDAILIPDDLELDLIFLRRALAEGRLSSSRVEEAVLRMLAVKAALGLHRGAERKRGLRPPSAKRLQEHRKWARDCTQAAVTLVRDEAGLLPLSPGRHRRVLLVEEKDRRNVNGSLPPLQVGRLLREQGFSVEDYSADTPVGTDWFDVLIYAVSGEGTFFGTSLEIDWERLHGELFRSMDRFWHSLPTMFISFGTPYRIREVPACPTIINAYSPVLPMQEAAIRALVGKAPFAGVSPVDLTPWLGESSVHPPAGCDEGNSRG